MTQRSPSPGELASAAGLPPPAAQSERFLSTRDVARTLGVSPTTVQMMVERGVLKAWRTSGGHRRISETSVHALLRQRPAARGEAPAAALQVLVAEDDEQILKLYEAKFKPWKLPVDLTMVSDGLKALIALGRKSSRRTDRGPRPAPRRRLRDAAHAPQGPSLFRHGYHRRLGPEPRQRQQERWGAGRHHELGTPLNAIVGLAALALEAEPGDEQREYLEIIRDSGHALRRMLDDVLDLAPDRVGGARQVGPRYVHCCAPPCRWWLPPRARNRSSCWCASIPWAPGRGDFGAHRPNPGGG